MTSDKQIVVIHDQILDIATNIDDHPEFASRYTTKIIYGKNYTGFFVDDFTLVEIKTLLVKQVMPWRDQNFNWLYQVPTLNETIQFLQAKQQELNKTIGLLIEEKSPAYYASIGLPIEPTLLTILTAYNYSLTEISPASVIIQSFESTSLQIINSTTRLPLIMLLSRDLNEKSW